MSIVRIFGHYACVFCMFGEHGFDLMSSDSRNGVSEETGEFQSNGKIGRGTLRYGSRL